MLDSLLLGQHPILPLWRSVGHAAQDDLGDLEAGVSKTDCSPGEHMSPISDDERTVGHLILVLAFTLCLSDLLGGIRRRGMEHAQVVGVHPQEMPKIFKMCGALG